MERATGLPDQNEYGCYEIRMESIGGLGANLCAKMLGEAGMERAGFNSAVFSSYGSEKTGTPVKGFVRFCEADKEIRLHSPILKPHLLAVFHEALLANPSTLEGCHEKTDVLINTVSGQSVLERNGTGSLLNRKPKRIFCIDAGQIAMDTKSRVNVVMLGAMAKMMGFIRLEDLYEICKKSLGRKYPAALSGNLEGIRRGYEEVEKFSGDWHGADRKAGWRGEKEIAAGSSGDGRNVRAGRGEKEAMQIGADVPVRGYETAPIGGINPDYGNSVVNDLSPSRQGYFPIFIPEKCINCGLCGSTCPDMVFQFQKGEYRGREMMINKGLDYYHCKGCMRCVDVCPVQALVSGREAEHPDKQYFMPNQELVRTPAYYRKAGPDGYITSESFLTEKRMEGGEV